ncbi:MAG: metal-sensitive transcriptional regulator [Dehalococcoidales bacterium]|nr:metal-sensitive transcriptional regulator [Dehalococcoidales bacterium]
MSAILRQHSYTKDKKALLTRMKRITGQAKGIQQMIEEDRYCIDVVQQLTALSAASDEVSLMILENHIKGCVSDAVRRENSEEYIKELMAALRKAIRR